MKNRNWLIDRNECDLLCEMNGRLRDVCKPICENAPCIMNCFMNPYEVDERCYDFGNCRDCIAAWLNEERR